MLAHCFILSENQGFCRVKCVIIKKCVASLLILCGCSVEKISTGDLEIRKEIKNK